jgi:hypothetical protein
MSHGLWVFIYVASLAVVIWGVADVARRRATVLATRRKALWMVGMIGGWLLSGLAGALVSVYYLAVARKRLSAGEYTSRY